jgi:hypothetical protein
MKLSFFKILFLVLVVSTTTFAAKRDSDAVAFQPHHAGVKVEIRAEELEREIGDRAMRVLEFQYIREQADRLGVKAYLFGGTAAAYGHYVKWDMQREKGDKTYQPDRFDYDITNIYRATQDLDVVVDGPAGKISELERLVMARFDYLAGSKAKWEMRSLRETRGDKLALLNNPDFLNQHTDSNSTGMVLVSTPQDKEPVVRDLRDFDSTKPQFLRDIAEGKLHFYFADKHETTKFYKEGRNPPILSVIRYFTKAVQFQLELREEDLRQVKKIIDSFDPQSARRNSYVAHWIEKNAKKLVLNAIDIEYSLNLLDRYGLRKKLIAITNDTYTQGSLAWWMNKAALPSLPVGKGKGQTAAQLKINIVAHETSDFDAYESITRAHTGAPNVLISRSGHSGEAAVYGDGFYTARGKEGARGTGLTIRYTVDPNAREGTDFILGGSGSYVIFQNRNAFRVIQESLNMSWMEYLQFLASGKSFDHSDKGILEKLKRRLDLRERSIPESELQQMKKFVLKNIDNRTLVEAFLERPFAARVPDVYVAAVEKGTLKAGAVLGSYMEEFKDLESVDWWKAWARVAFLSIEQQNRVHNDLLEFIKAHFFKHNPALESPENLKLLNELLRRDMLVELVSEGSVKAAYKKNKTIQKLVIRLFDEGRHDKVLTEKLLADATPQELPDFQKFMEAIMDRGAADHYLIAKVLSRPEVATHPQWATWVLRMANQNNENLDRLISHFVFSNAQLAKQFDFSPEATQIPDTRRASLGLPSVAVVAPPRASKPAGVMNWLKTKLQPQAPANQCGLIF